MVGALHATDLPEDSRSAWWLYTVRIVSGRRARFFEHMKDRSIMASAVHQRNDTHSCVARFISHLPQLNSLSQEVACLPVGWWLSTTDCERIVDAVKAFSAAGGARAAACCRPPLSARRTADDTARVWLAM